MIRANRLPFGLTGSVEKSLFHSFLPLKMNTFEAAVSISCSYLIKANGNSVAIVGQFHHLSSIIGNTAEIMCFLKTLKVTSTRV